MIFQNRMQPKKRPALSSIINDEGREVQKQSPRNGKYRPRTVIEINKDQESSNPSPKKASRKNNNRSVTEITERAEMVEKKTQVHVVMKS